MAEVSYEFKKSTKYLLLFVFLLLLLGIGFVVRGFILPWRQTSISYHPIAQIEIDESLLKSADLTTLVQFNHIPYPDQRIGRADLLSWPTGQPEVELEETIEETEEIEPEIEVEGE